MLIVRRKEENKQFVAPTGKVALFVYSLFAVFHSSKQYSLARSTIYLVVFGHRRKRESRKERVCERAINQERESVCVSGSHDQNQNRQRWYYKCQCAVLVSTTSGDLGGRAQTASVPLVLLTLLPPLSWPANQISSREDGAGSANSDGGGAICWREEKVMPV